MGKIAICWHLCRKVFELNAANNADCHLAFPDNAVPWKRPRVEQIAVFRQLARNVDWDLNNSTTQRLLTLALRVTKEPSANLGGLVSNMSSIFG